MTSFTYILRIFVTTIFLAAAVVPISQSRQGVTEAVPIGSFFRSIDVSSLASAEAWPDYNRTRPTTMRTRTNPVMGSAIFDRMSGTTRFLFGFDLYAHHIILLFGVLLISKLAFEKKKYRILAQERCIAKEHTENFERNQVKGSSHIRTRRGYYLIDDVVEIAVV